jgi:signal transduction histidine kinase
VQLVVEAEGPGVPDDLQPSIFEPFRQGENARGGVGIGLSLVGRFAELHGGAARIEDREGGGARFVVQLPGDRSPAPAPFDEPTVTVDLAV